MSVVGGQPEKKNTQIPVIKQQITSNALSNFYLLPVLHVLFSLFRCKILPKREYH